MSEEPRYNFLIETSAWPNFQGYLQRLLNNSFTYTYILTTSRRMYKIVKMINLALICILCLNANLIHKNEDDVLKLSKLLFGLKMKCK